jgi:multisubunit Na+/H+ antiporter MnhB subunit
MAAASLQKKGLRYLRHLGKNTGFWRERPISSDRQNIRIFMKQKPFALSAIFDPRRLTAILICGVGLSLGLFAFIAKAAPGGGLHGNE